MVNDEFVEKGYPVSKVLVLDGLPKSSYYYQAKDTKPGKREVKYILDKEGNIIALSEVVKAIEKLLSHEFVDYGYYKVYIHLTRKMGYKIGSSKVYKLMKNNGCLSFKGLQEN